MADQAKCNKIPFAQVWCVFDRDSFSKEQFNTAINMAESYGFKVAYSNEAFELWYVLHFEDLSAGIERERYIEKLTYYLGKDYKKDSLDMYDILGRRQADAIKRAKKLLSIYSGKNYAEKNPSTTVFALVEELNLYKR